MILHCEAGVAATVHEPMHASYKLEGQRECSEGVGGSCREECRRLSTHGGGVRGGLPGTCRGSAAKALEACEVAQLVSQGSAILQQNTCWLAPSPNSLYLAFTLISPTKGWDGGVDSQRGPPSLRIVKVQSRLQTAYFTGFPLQLWQVSSAIPPLQKPS
jgi:hypothetical protein